MPLGQFHVLLLLLFCQSSFSECFVLGLIMKFSTLVVPSLIHVFKLVYLTRYIIFQCYYVLHVDRILQCCSPGCSSVYCGWLSRLRSSCSLTVWWCLVPLLVLCCNMWILSLLYFSVHLNLCFWLLICLIYNV